METIPDTYSGGDARTLRAVTTYEVVCLPQNAHGHAWRGDVQAMS